MTFPFRWRLRRKHAVTAASLALLVIPAIRAASGTDDEVVELPKFVVTDSRALPPPESWRYAKMPGFEILSSASDRTTQRLMQDFQMFREALDVVWPMPAQLNTPVLLILCDHAGKFQSFVPPKTDGGADVARASVYLKGRLVSAIVIDVGTTVINIATPDAADPASGEDPTQFAIEHNKQLYREYVRYLLSRSNPRLPAWFEEGMCQIIMAMQFDPKWIELGKLHDANTVSAAAGMAASMNALNATNSGFNSDAGGGSNSSDDPSMNPDVMPGEPAEDKDFNGALAHRALLPMAEVFAVDHDSPLAVNPLGNNTWAKQCYAFVHLGLFGERGRWQKPFTEFLVRSAQGPVTEQTFKDCFHMSYRDMGIELRGYIQSTYYQSKIYKAKDGRAFLNSEPVALRDATPAEIGRIKGEAMELAGNLTEARTELIAPYIRGARDPQLLAALGEVEESASKPDRARKFLEAAVAGKTTDPQAYLDLAHFRIADAEAKPGAPDGRFSPEQASAIISLLKTARTLPPPQPETYDLWGETLARTAGHASKADIAPLVEGVRFFPNHLRLVYVTAALCADAGLNDAAYSLVDYGIKSAPTDAARANFTKLKATLPPQPAAAAPADSKG